MAEAGDLVEFTIDEQAPLAAELRTVAEWVESQAYQEGFHSRKPADLKNHAAGRKILDADPEQARKYVVAAVAHALHWEAIGRQIQDESIGQPLTPDCRFHREWPQAQNRKEKAEAVIRTLMRRKLPFQPGDLAVFVDWCLRREELTTWEVPIGAIVRALEHEFCDGRPDGEFRKGLTWFADRLRSSRDNNAVKFATAVEQICKAEPGASDDLDLSAIIPPPQPAAAGHPAVLIELKRFLGIPLENPPGTCEPHPSACEHHFLDETHADLNHCDGFFKSKMSKTPSGLKVRQMKPEQRGRLLVACAERRMDEFLADAHRHDFVRGFPHPVKDGMMQALLELPIQFSRDALFDLLLYLAAAPTYELNRHQESLEKLLVWTTEFAAESPLTEGERYVLWLLRAALILGPPLGDRDETMNRLTDLIGDGARFLLVPGETWSDAVNEDFSRMSAEQQPKWIALFAHALTATASRPSKKWLKTAGDLTEVIGGEEVRSAFERWLPLTGQRGVLRQYGIAVDGPPTMIDVMHDENATCLKGLLWMIQTLPDPDPLARHVASVALSAYRKLPGIGPRCAKVGNAAVYGLSAISSTAAVGQLAVLKVRVKTVSAQKEIEKAFMAAAEALGLSRDEIEEMGVPSYGLEAGGTKEELLGDYRAELVVTGSSADLHWFDPKGKQLKSVPAKVKSEHAEELKELKQSLKDIQSMLPAQRDRIDSLFLLQKSWPIAVWRERYLDHPLVGTIARRLIWCVDGTPVLFLDETPRDVAGKPVEHGQTAEITLWHPVGRSVEEIVGWRRRLEEMELTQPFKQAHREVYLLTDAERNTRTYSNRYAAHLIRQHQFHALCAARGWRNKLRLLVDDVYPPASKELPQWGLRAEFWVEGIGDDWGIDTNDSGTFLRLATDQVRFYRTEAAQNYSHASGGGYGHFALDPPMGEIHEPLPLEQVPPLVFSEIMRDIDLFVGVASVGNDPNWADGGPEGRHRDYWQSYSFGELSGTAATRKEVLQRLVPRLKIADRCSFNDRFLVVRGDRRTYKIHLGSGNILMEPNDQYLCIVPDSRARAQQAGLFLPFEGDNMLSIILSKALLLAEDTKIKDPTITRQIDLR